MNKLLVTALSMLAVTHAAASETNADTIAKTDSGNKDAPYTGKPIDRDQKLSKAALSNDEVLVCTSRGCFAVKADSIDLTQVFLTKAVNGQNVLVPYHNTRGNRFEDTVRVSGALDPSLAPRLPPYVTRLIEFDERDPVFDQQTYEMRVRAEADIMIALEAEKSDITLLYSRVSELNSLIQRQKSVVSSRAQAAQENLTIQQRTQHEYDNRSIRLGQLQDDCQQSEKNNEENRRMLILYCQQFAFAADMQPACRNLLTCRQRELRFGYTNFNRPQERQATKAFTEMEDFGWYSGLDSPHSHSISVNSGDDYDDQVHVNSGDDYEINVNSGDDYEVNDEVVTICANCQGWGVDGNPWA